jgi:hypothetical protein
MTHAMNWPRVAVLAMTLCALALLLYTLGAPHIGGG